MNKKQTVKVSQREELLNEVADIIISQMESPDRLFSVIVESYHLAAQILKETQEEASENLTSMMYTLSNSVLLPWFQGGKNPKQGIVKGLYGMYDAFGIEDYVDVQQGIYRCIIKESENSNVGPVGYEIWFDAITMIQKIGPKLKAAWDAERPVNAQAN